MKAPLALRPLLRRGYANRIPERPPYRAPDPLKKNPNATYHQLEDDVTFIHRPPPSAPTPHSLTTAPASPLLYASPLAGAEVPLVPPALRELKEAPPRMSSEDLEKMRRLRQEDPQTWTRGKLAKEFNCRPWFVAAAAPLKSADRKAAVKKRDEEHQSVRETWGERKSIVREIRQKRREFW